MREARACERRLFRDERQALIGVLSKGAILGDVHDIKAEKVVPGVTLCAFETSYHP